MRFGFATIPGETGEFTALVRDAEAMGFHQAWVPDQTFHRDVFAVLAACAAEARRIALGVGVTNPFTRHPVQIARAAATVDEISGGRLTVGIGAGNRRELLRPLGLEQERTAQRCAEAVAVIKGLLRGERVTHESDTLTVRDVALDFAARANLPVYLAGRGRLVLRAAGERADGVIIGALSDPQGLRYALAQVEAGAAAAGRTLDGFGVVSWVTCLLTDDRAATLEAIRPSIAHVIGGAPAEVLLGIGLDAGLVRRVKDGYATGGPLAAAQHVTPDVVDRLAIVGDGPYVVDRVALLRGHGVTQVVVLLPGRGARSSHSAPDVDHRALLRRFAEQVIARL
ncbi:MAG: LLM class flavin-dependent oxidoreductase [Armatimonadota bacterium]|nr:LLM class flavin-dependent oxidoreductase [Armatimonadota bacterium]MDR7421562.1 LLM class flavin-dependent oxidoreductase [Armatimonadota bacterium]MDR7458089.1 LLM class flavin-dependent oxidoreductase [Armatimonadota bacterium]MDR7496513.1 LLM class flavin-dependent oxidoreductase [Armatimonadota bacterium]